MIGLNFSLHSLQVTVHIDTDQRANAADEQREQQICLYLKDVGRDLPLYQTFIEVEVSVHLGLPEIDACSYRQSF